MEELIAGFVSSHITLDEADVSLIHPRYSQYKLKSLVTSQEKRRNQWLKEHKEKRFDYLNLQRGLVDCDDDFSMDVDGKKERHKKVYYSEYKGYLMLSEWLIAVPDDMKTNWLCTICPEGKRALVVATKGRTSAYGRNGASIFSSFPSWLPGGSKLANRGKTMLDTIFDQSSSTFYILDILQWSIETGGFEAEMRFYWIATKVSEEIPQIKDQCTTNKYKFITLDHFPYSQLAEKMLVHPIFPGNSPRVDGILFFHRESSYVHTRSPLVTWLKPFMLPDILNIPVAPEYLLEKPPDYPNKMETEEMQST